MMTTTTTIHADQPSYSTCKEVDNLLMAYVDDELSPGERAAFDRHLCVCRSCVNAVDAYTQTIRLTKWAMRGAPTEGLEEVGDHDRGVMLPPALMRSILKSRQRML